MGAGMSKRREIFEFYVTKFMSEHELCNLT